ncbi:hypothetical protein PCURB6_27310 [Paenibacillus curdlanolyticus]|nr:hypothetical protein PCURB6_27310 [Paenibacillus curdlanolyticus]
MGISDRVLSSARYWLDKLKTNDLKCKSASEVMIKAKEDVIRSIKK